MEIRLMTMEDYPAVFGLWQNAEGMGLRSLDDSEAGIRAFLARNPASCFIALCDGAIAGAILGGHDGRRGNIYHTVVAKQYQDLGIGKSLVNAVLVALEAQGINKVNLVVFRTNENGNAFWEALGFEERTDLVYRGKSLNTDNR
jgi:ribosomal protein S18 acetylase RimI-like enzyme